MALAVTHGKVSAIADGTDSSVVLPSEWNAAHTLTGTVSVAQGGTTVGADVLFSAPTGATLGVRSVFLGYQAGMSFLSTDTSQANVGIGDQALAALHSDEPNGHANTAVGGKAGISLTTGSQNVFIGGACGTNNVTSSMQTLIGYHCGLLNTGSNNTAIGNQALGSSGAGGAADSNVAIGILAIPALTSGGTNVGIGRSVLEVLTTGSNNVSVGTASLRSCITGSGNVALGTSAGRYATGSNEFYVDNQDRTNTAGDVAGALLYGTFSATPASQTLRINASTTIVGALSLKSGATTINGLSWDATNILIGATTARLVPQDSFTTALSGPSNGQVWFEGDGSGLTSARVQLKARANGATLTLGDSAVFALPVVYVYKGTSTDRTSTAAYADDPDLFATLAASTTYHFKFVLRIQVTSATEGIKISMSGTAGVNEAFAEGRLYDDVLHTLVSTGLKVNLAQQGLIFNALSTGTHYAIVEGSIVTTTSGTIGIQWAQLVSGLNLTRMAAGSILIVTKVR